MAALDYDLLARYYDALVVGGEDVEFFVTRVRQAGGRSLELMAGTGRVSVPVLEAGLDLSCVDSSAAMLARLRKKLESAGLTAPLHERDVSYLDLATRFSLAFIAFHSFEELTGDEERSRALKRIHAHIVPGGTFICTLHDPAVRARETGPGKDFSRELVDPESKRKIRLNLRTSHDPSTSIVSGEQSFRDVETGETLLSLPISFRLCGADEFASIAQAAGFVVEKVEGDYTGGPYEEGRSPTMIWTLRRRESL